MNILVIGADTCIGHAIWKSMLVDNKFAIYGIYTKFSHYGSACFTYARKRNVFDLAELEKKECFQYLSNNSYDVIYWCVDVVSKENFEKCKKTWNSHQKYLSEFTYQKICFFKEDNCLLQSDEIMTGHENVVMISVPEVFGVYQRKQNVVSDIIINEGQKEAEDQEKIIELISAWCLAEALKSNRYKNDDLKAYTVSMSLSTLTEIIHELMKKDYVDIEYCKQLLKEQDQQLVTKFIYHMLETIEFYISNYNYYRGGR